jgi:hypothetical protein
MMIFLFHVTRYSNITFLLSKYICRPDVSELETKLAEQSKVLLNLQQKVDDLASKVYPNLVSFYLFIFLICSKGPFVFLLFDKNLHYHVYNSHCVHIREESFCKVFIRFVALDMMLPFLEKLLL